MKGFACLAIVATTLCLATQTYAWTVSVDGGNSNSWWLQVNTNPAASSVRIAISGSSLTMSPVQGGQNQAWKAKPDQEISFGVSATITVDGKSCTLTWKGGSSCGSGGAATNGASASLNNLPGKVAGRNVHVGYATHYDAIAAGTPVCGFDTKYCGAPSTATGLVGPCSGASGNCQDCMKGYCSFPGCVAPSCSKTGCGRKIKIWCIDDAGRCATNQPVIMTVNSACPATHPCNTCKPGSLGIPNLCAQSNHFDLCDATFNAIAVASAQPAAGTKIAYQLLVS